MGSVTDALMPAFVLIAASPPMPDLSLFYLPCSTRI